VSDDMSCDRCNKHVFFSEKKATWANTYDFVAMEPKDELVRCSRCSQKFGRLRSNARPSNGDMSPYEGFIR